MPNEKLINKGKQLDTMFDRGIDWLDRKNALSKKLSTELHHRQRLTQKITKALNNKPVFAAFGKSQVGKSYLMKNILADETNPLLIDFGDGRLHDFIGEINPIGGGQESTGVVTRFTIDKNLGGDYPVTIKLLEVKDLIIIFSKALFENIEYQLPSKDSLYSQLERLEIRDWENNIPIKIDTYDAREIRSYLETKYRDQQGFWRDLDEVGYWGFIDRQFEKIISSTTYFEAVFSILWMNNELLSKQFRYLLEASSQLRFKIEAKTEIRSILRPETETEEGQNGLGLIEVKCVESLASEDGQGDKITVSISTNEEVLNVQINKDALSALCKEITLSVKTEGLEGRSFLETTDLMDFPGARGKRDLKEESTQSNDVPKGIAFLRGKVAYLFEKYSNDFEMNNLLFCIPPEANNITELPNTLNDWIKRNVGENPEQRHTRLASMQSSPLMIILTKWNINLEGDPGDTPQNLPNTWDKVFNTFLINEYFSGRGWDKNWEAEGDKFTNYYPLRDFKYSKSFFESSDTDDKETGLSPNFQKQNFNDAQDYFSKLKQAFLDFSFVQESIPNPETVWEASSTPGNDGSKPIIEALNKAAQVSGFDQHGAEVLETAKSKLLDVISPFLRGVDEESQRKNGREFVQRLKRVSNPLIVHQSDLLYRIQLALMANSKDFLSLLREQPASRIVNNPDDIQNFLMLYPSLNDQMSIDEMVMALSAELGVPKSEVKTHVSQDYNIALDSLFQPQEFDVNTLISDVIDIYAEDKLKMNYEVESIIRDGFDEEVMSILLDQFKNGLKNRAVAEKLDPILRHMSGDLAMGNYDEKLIARLIAKWWNEYIVECDQRFYTDQEQEDLVALDSGRLAFAPPLQIDQNEAYKLLEDLFEQEPRANLQHIHVKPGIEKLQSWIANIERIVMMNCGGVVFDHEEQEDLSQILDAIQGLSFQTETI